jgi:PadR family transcriptional regulator PadR
LYQVLSIIRHTVLVDVPIDPFIYFVNIGDRNRTPNKELEREILLAFWKVHILHHAGEQPLHGQWMLTELAEHGYKISPGTLYPLLQRMERLGWLRSKSTPRRGRARKDYRLTAAGRKVLRVLREQVRELYQEVVLETEEAEHKKR